MKLRAVILIQSLLQVASANKVVHSLADDLPYDENGKLASHVLVYSEGRCANIIQEHFHNQFGDKGPDKIELRPIAGNAQRTFFGGEGGGVVNSPPQHVNDCRSICLERGVDQSLIASPMPFRRFDGVAADGDESFDDWFLNACQKTEVCFMNYHNPNAPVNMNWVTPEGQERFHRAIGYGEPKTFCCDSYLGHKFVFRDSEKPDEILREYTVEYVCMVSIGESPPYTVNPNKNYTKAIETTLDSEWDRHNRIKRTFSELGFKTGRLPDDLFGSMGAFHYNNFDNRVREEWTGKGVFVNWWEIDVLFIQIPWKLKDSWQGRLRELVEYWVGERLEQTDMYGLRRYEHGARLLTHVDREATHAASLIVNIAQGNVEEPWPVEVHDHADRLHQVTMQPGDIVYYESARCLHGRNTPLKGEGSYYVNLFTHYRPIGDAKWFNRPNPKGTPKPLLDVGSCQLTGDKKVMGEGVVQCDDPSIGPWLSPSMFTAHSGKDLMQWWRDVSPPVEEAPEGEENDDGSSSNPPEIEDEL